MNKYSWNTGRNRWHMVGVIDKRMVIFWTDQKSIVARIGVLNQATAIIQISQISNPQKEIFTNTIYKI